jgi:hypothetical protein
LCIVVAGVVDATGFEKYAPSDSIGLDREAVRPYDTKILLGRIFVWVEIVHGEKGLALLFIQRINLLGYVTLQPFIASLALRCCDDWLFFENSCAFRDAYACDKSFAPSRNVS